MVSAAQTTNVHSSSFPIDDRITFAYPALFVSSGCGSRPVTLRAVSQGERALKYDYGLPSTGNERRGL